MSIAIEHPARNRSIQVLTILATFVVAALVALVVIQWSGVASSNDQPSAPATRSPAEGPNADLAPDWASRQAGVLPGVAAEGPNADLAPDWVGSVVAAPEPNVGPNAGLAPDRISQHAAAVAVGPNVGLPPTWAENR